MKRKLKILSIGVGILLVCGYGVAVALDPNNHTQTPVAPVTEQITPDAIYNLVNVERKKAGVPELVKNDLATKAAEQKCADMVANNYYEHVNPTTGKHGYDYTTALIPNGTGFSENMNQGDVKTNQAFVDSWLKSEGHKKAMLEPRYTETGVAVCKIPSEPAGSHTVVQEFVEIKAVNQQPKDGNPTASQSSSSPSIPDGCTARDVRQITLDNDIASYNAMTVHQDNVNRLSAMGHWDRNDPVVSAEDNRHLSEKEALSKKYQTALLAFNDRC